jgi:hypothetical protein
MIVHSSLHIGCAAETIHTKFCTGNDTGYLFKIPVAPRDSTGKDSQGKIFGKPIFFRNLSNIIFFKISVVIIKNRKNSVYYDEKDLIMRVFETNFLTTRWPKFFFVARNRIFRRR